MSSPFDVLVLGDVSIDRRAIRVDWSGRFAPSEPKWQQQQGLRSFDIPGGAWFVAACIRRALSPSVTVTHHIENLAFDWATIEALQLKKATMTLRSGRSGRIAIDGASRPFEEALVYIGRGPEAPLSPGKFVLEFSKIPLIECIQRPADVTAAGPNAGLGKLEVRCASVELDGHVLRNAKDVKGAMANAYLQVALPDIMPDKVTSDDGTVTDRPHQFSIEDTWVVAADFEGASFARATFGGRTDAHKSVAVTRGAVDGPARVTTYQRQQNARELVQSWAELDLFPMRPDDKAAKVYRIRTLRGFAGPEREPVSGINPPEYFPAKLSAEPPAPSVLVIEDQGNGYRDDSRCLDQLEQLAEQAGLFVYKMTKSIPALQSRFWTTLRAHWDRVIAVISAEALRDVGVDLAPGLSWERLAEDLLGALGSHAVLKQLTQFRYLVVRFCLSGAALISRTTRDGTPELQALFFDPGHIEGTFRNPQTDGVLTGYNSVLVGSIIAALAQAGITRTATGLTGDIGAAMAAGIQSGLKNCRAYFDTGLGASLAELGQLIHDVLPDSLVQTLGPPEFAQARGDRLGLPRQGILSLFEVACSDADDERIAWLAQQIIQAGLTKAFAKLEPHEKFPFASFGDSFLVVDRREIDGYRAISTLVTNYAEHPAPPRPLSLAVFGQPGAGKSFGVKQIALNLLGRDCVTFIESNLAQFSSADDLADVFFSVRDVTLQAGKLPIVFFDEFDAQLGGPLGWLKYFLAPMQDGRFKYKQTTLGIGKAIFVFAGGTRKKYEHLVTPPTNDDIVGDDAGYFKYIKSEEPHRYSAKVNDFLRRLRGTVDIASIDPGWDPAPTPPTKPGADRPDPLLGPDSANPAPLFPPLYLIRRAILFRSLLRKLAPHLLDDRGPARVDPGVIQAFLKVPRYKHGAGSMEALLEISSLRTHQFFTKAALPAQTLLDMHVDAKDFLKWLRQPIEDSSRA